MAYRTDPRTFDQFHQRGAQIRAQGIQRSQEAMQPMWNQLASLPMQMRQEHIAESERQRQHDWRQANTQRMEALTRREDQASQAREDQMTWNGFVDQGAVETKDPLTGSIQINIQESLQNASALAETAGFPNANSYKRATAREFRQANQENDQISIDRLAVAGKYAGAGWTLMVPYVGQDRSGMTEKEFAHINENAKRSDPSWVDVGRDTNDNDWTVATRHLGSFANLSVDQQNYMMSIADQDPNSPMAQQQIWPKAIEALSGVWRGLVDAQGASGDGVDWTRVDDSISNILDHHPELESRLGDLRSQVGTFESYNGSEGMIPEKRMRELIKQINSPGEDLTVEWTDAQGNVYPLGSHGHLVAQTARMLGKPPEDWNAEEQEDFRQYYEKNRYDIDERFRSATESNVLSTLLGRNWEHRYEDDPEGLREALISSQDTMNAAFGQGARSRQNRFDITGFLNEQAKKLFEADPDRVFDAGEDLWTSMTEEELIDGVQTFERITDSPNRQNEDGETFNAEGWLNQIARNEIGPEADWVDLSQARIKKGLRGFASVQFEDTEKLSSQQIAETIKAYGQHVSELEKEFAQQNVQTNRMGEAGPIPKINPERHRVLVEGLYNRLTTGLGQAGTDPDDIMDFIDTFASVFEEAAKAGKIDADDPAFAKGFQEGTLRVDGDMLKRVITGRGIDEGDFEWLLETYPEEFQEFSHMVGDPKSLKVLLQQYLWQTSSGMTSLISDGRVFGEGWQPRTDPQYRDDMENLSIQSLPSDSNLRARAEAGDAEAIAELQAVGYGHREQDIHLRRRRTERQTPLTFFVRPRVPGIVTPGVDLTEAQFGR